MCALLRQSPPSICYAQRFKSLSNRPNHPLCINRCSARRLPGSRLTSLAVRAQQQAPQEKPSGLQSAQTLWLPTITATSSGLASVEGEVKANVVFPSLVVPKKGDPPVRVWPHGGVVLFMHGFAQGPLAYARILTQLAEECDVLVVAPCPPFRKKREELQPAMVEAALFWRNLIATNALPGIIMAPDAGSSAASSSSSASSSPGSCPLPVGLLAHSVGGGLAPYVVDTAARKGQPFTSAHVMAPQTFVVIPEYHYNSLATDGKLQPPAAVPTAWAVQYGYLDLLSPFFTVDGFRSWLTDRGVLRKSFKYCLGTHVGFEDQLVVGAESFTAGFLPRLLALLLGASPLLLLMLGAQAVVSAMSAMWPCLDKLWGKKDAVSGFGNPDKVELPDERSMLLAYVVLAAIFTAAAVLLMPYDWQWDSLGAGTLSALKAITPVLAAFAWPNILVYPCVAMCQRPKVRSTVSMWFRKQMAADVSPAAARRAAVALGGKPAGGAGAVIATTAAAAAAAAALSYGIIITFEALY